MENLTAIQRAAILLHLDEQRGGMNGPAIAALRRDVAAGIHDHEAEAAGADLHKKAVFEIARQGFAPSRHMTRLLIEAVSQRRGGCPLGQAWEALGIPARTGAGFTSAGKADRLTWPEFFTLRAAAAAPSKAAGIIDPLWMA